MTILKIEKYPAKVLQQTAKPVNEVTAEITNLLDDMAETMYANHGVGLAAPQVGVSKRMIVVDVGEEKEDGSIEKKLVQIINPEIVSKEGDIEWEEGCLSVPDFTLKINRAEMVTLKGLDKTGKPMEIHAKGLFAVALQHEIDHLNGKVIIDNVSRLKRNFYIKEQKKKHLRENEPTYL